MRLMAGVAEHAARVLRGSDLREAVRLGCVFFVAPPAEVGDVGELRLVSRRVVGGGVLRLRSVTGFAGDVGVAAGGADLGLVVVAKRAGVLAGVRDGPLPDHVERRRPVMAIFAESFRNDGGANYQKKTEPGQEHERWADQMA